VIIPTVIAAPFFALSIALESLYDSRQRAREYERVDAWTNIGVGLISLVWGALFGFLHYKIYLALYALSPFSIPTNLIWPWVALFFLDDFLYYWFHRFSHEIRFLWNFHVVHHSSEHFNLSVAVRQSWFSGVSHWIFYAPLALLGFAPWMMVTMHAFNIIYQFWIHTPFVKSIGPFEYFLNTPSHHRVHHGVNPQYLDKNYAGVLIIWDKLFGTFEPEVEQPVYGIVKPISSFNMLWINTHAWAETFAAIKTRKNLSGKLRCFLCAPSLDF
jgi:sterol desaturase/sphingolipid hydroxylase (fatty acid hydroxylase superfamily)